MRHRHTAQLRWSDPDMLGHVNHARMLSLVEDARIALCLLGPRRDDSGVGGVILVHLEVDYLRQVRYRVDEALPVESWVTKIGTKSFALRQELSQDGQVAARVDATCVAFDYATDATRALDDEEREFWGRYLEDAP
ncbi:MAG: acyl-CoA thioesterase [Micromonosporaceae bacterium]